MLYFVVKVKCNCMNYTIALKNNPKDEEMFCCKNCGKFLNLLEWELIDKVRAKSASEALRMFEYV